MDSSYIRHHHVKGKSMNIASENKELKLKTLKEKMENPFWIPPNNADLFLVKQIYREDRKIQKAISLSKTRRPLSKFKAPSENFTMTNLKNFTNVYLTEQAKMNQTCETKFDSNQNTFGSTNPTKMLELISQKKRGSTAPDSPKRNNSVLDRKIQGIEGPKVDSIRSYVDKTRQMLLMKYSMKIKEERIVRMVETYKNEIESVKDSIITMNTAKSKFEDEFYKKYQKYMKYLAVEKEKERKVLNDKLDEKSSHDAEIRQFENKINKLKDKIELYNEYKLFLICIKEKRLYFAKPIKQTITNLNSTLESVSTAKDNSIMKDSVYVTQGTFKQAKSVSPISKAKTMRKGKTIMISKFDTVDEEEDKARLMAKYDLYRKKIFEQQEELINEMKRMEAKNLDLLSEANEQELVLSELHKETKKTEAEDKTSNLSITREIIRKEEELKEMKEKHSKLKEERDLLERQKALSQTIHEREKSNSTAKTKLFKTQLFSKIVSMYKKCCELNIDKETSSEVAKRMSLHSDNQLEMMRLIEKSYYYLLKKYEEFGRTALEERKLFEKYLETERKKQIAMEQLRENEKKSERLMEKIAERYNKVIIKPSRKIADRRKPEEKKKKEKANLDNENEPNLLELLHYEGDDNN